MSVEGLLDRLSCLMQLANGAESTIACYSCIVRDLCLKIGKLPDQIEQDEIEEDGPEGPSLLGLKDRLSENTPSIHIGPSLKPPPDPSAWADTL
ncbi:MAG: hypothetical protein AAF587_24400 [Bacteroidota bacterium]